MSRSEVPSPLPTIDTVEFRQRLAGLVDPMPVKQQFFDSHAKELSVRFLASLPKIFGSSLDRITMWDKIAAAVQSAYAKNASGDTDLFVQHVLETIQAEPSKVVACESFEKALDEISGLSRSQQQDWLVYLATHLVPVLVFARREYKSGGAE